MKGASSFRVAKRLKVTAMQLINTGLIISGSLKIKAAADRSCPLSHLGFGFGFVAIFISNACID